MRLALVLLALVAVIATAGCNQEQKSDYTFIEGGYREEE